MIKLTLIIPTCDREDKIYRQLLYILHCATISEELYYILQNIEILIGDGSSESLDKTNNNKINSCLRTLSKVTNTKYIHMPNLSFPERVGKLGEAAKGKYILMCGDDDLIIFESAWKLLMELENNKEIKSITGVFLNIRGWNNANFIFDPQERLYADFILKSPVFLQRWVQYTTINSLGTTSLAYCIVPKKEFNILGKILKNNSDLYHGGIELLFQLFFNAIGNLKISKIPFLLRDFTYLDYKYDVMREAPNEDKYPYNGERAIQIASQILSQYSTDLQIKESEAEEVISNMLSFGRDLQPIRGVIGKAIDKEVLNTKHLENTELINGQRNCLTTAHKIWIKTSKECYPSLAKRIVQTGTEGGKARG